MIDFATGLEALQATETWEHQPGFGQYLKDLRKEMGLSQRECAKVLGMSNGYLAKIEGGTSGFRPLRTEVLHRAADLFNIPRHEFLVAAGYKGLPVPVNLDIDQFDGSDDQPDPAVVRERFLRVVLHPSLRPEGLSEEALDYISVKLLTAWVAFAGNLERHLRAGGDSIEVLARLPEKKEMP